MGSRGFFAELQRQQRIRERDAERARRQAARDHAARVRRLEQTRKEAERAQVQFAKAEAAERKRLEKEARETHIAAMEAEVEERNQELAEIYEDIDSLLASTLSKDDYVDLKMLHVEAKHPPFDRTDLEKPIPVPMPVADPSEPILRLPEAPRGLAAFFRKKKHARTVEEAQRNHEQALAEWRAKCSGIAEMRRTALGKHARDEQARIERLAKEKERYASDCRAREDEAAAKNRKLEELITNLGYGTVEAVQEYVSIVLSNSVYPDHFPVNHEFEFDPQTAELTLTVEIPGPDQLSTVKAYKYAKSADEITETALSQKECRERYAGAVHQVALRSFHEVFEADRRGLVRTISLEVGTTAVDPATGRRGYVPFVIAAAERDSFLAFDLSAVVPASTLTHLGASVSKNPYSMAAAERTGIRRA